MRDITVERPEHRIELRVYYQDTDTGGVVYHANYLNFAERGRNEIMRELGFPCSRLFKEFGMVFVIRHCSIDYKAPGHLDDLLTVASRVTELGGASMRMEQKILRGEEELAIVDIKIGCVTPQGRAMRMPPELKARFLEVFTVKQ